jgi:DNA-binding Lrp family transcriptional regulator
VARPGNDDARVRSTPRGVARVARFARRSTLAHRVVITTIVLIRVEPAQIQTAANMLAGVEGVTEVYSVSGDWDLVAIVRVPQYDQIAHVITEIFPTVPGIQRTQTLTAFRAYSRKDLQQAWDIGVE